MVELLAPYLEMEDYNMETAKRVRNGWNSSVASCVRNEI